MKITSIVDLRNDMLKAWESFRAGKIENEYIKQVANMAGKVMGSAKLQVEYQKLIKSQALIPFLTSKEVYEEREKNK